MKTNKRIQHSLVANVLNITVPTAWSQLSDSDKMYVFGLLKNRNYTKEQLYVLCLIRFAQLRVVSEDDYGWNLSVRIGFLKRKTISLKLWELHYYLKNLSFLTDEPTECSPVQKIKGLTAVDSLFRHVPFNDYLAAENFYQGFMFEKNTAHLIGLARILYRKKDGSKTKIQFNDKELYACFFWWYSLKSVYSARFSYFFSRVETPEGEEIEMPDMVALVTAEVRALTGGDITKNPAIFMSDTYQALTELNQKAREVAELNKPNTD